MSWLDDAACRGMSPSLFFLERKDTKGLARARAICAGCPVRDRCLEEAERRGETWGVWGGLSVEQRKQRARERATRRECVVCGVVFASAAYRVTCSDACAVARKAERDATRARRRGVAA